MKKQICILLALLLASGTMTACSQDAVEETIAAETTDTAAAATEEPAYSPAVENFGGVTFTILHPSERYYDIAEESNGEIVNDAIFERDSMLEDTYNIKFQHEQESDAHAVRQIYNDRIRAVVMSNDPVYDMIYGIESCTVETFIEGLYYNLLDFEEMNLDEIWWCPDQADTLAIHGLLFGGMGLSTLDLYKESSVFFFNMQLIDNYGMENPNKAVIEGDWTLDMFLEMTAQATQDLDGNGRYEYTKDAIGFLSRWTNNCSWQTGLDITVLREDDNGNIVAEVNDRGAEAVDVIKNFLSANKHCMVISNDKETQFGDAFKADRVLFYCERLKTSETLRDMTSDYGVLPFPKLNAEQEHYYSQAATAITMILFPLSVSDPHMSATLSEAMSFYGYEQIVPKYYESALKAKYMREEESNQILDIIFAHTVNNLTYAYTGTIGGSTWTNQVFQLCAFEGKEYASTIATNKEVWETNLQKIYDTFAELKAGS